MIHSLNQQDFIDMLTLRLSFESGSGKMSALVKRLVRKICPGEGQYSLALPFPTPMILENPESEIRNYLINTRRLVAANDPAVSR